MFVLIIVTAIIVHLTHLHRHSILNLFRGITGFFAGFFVTGCLGLLLMPLILAILCRLSLWAIFG